MKRGLSLLLIAFMAVSLQGCFISIGDFISNGCISGNGIAMTETRSHANFQKVRNSSSANIYISRGPSYSVSVRAESNILPNVRTRLNGSTLEVDMIGCLTTRQEVAVYVTMPELNEVTTSGSGNIMSSDIWQTGMIVVVNTGSGSVSLGLDAASVRTEISGSGSVTLFNRAMQQDATITGSGSYHAATLNTEVARMIISGSGNANIAVNSSLTARLSGSGSVYYRGNPARVDVNATGSGRVVKM